MDSVDYSTMTTRQIEYLSRARVEIYDIETAKALKRPYLETKEGSAICHEDWERQCIFNCDTDTGELNPLFINAMLDKFREAAEFFGLEYDGISLQNCTENMTSYLERHSEHLYACWTVMDNDSYDERIYSIQDPEDRKNERIRVLQECEDITRELAPRQVISNIHGQLDYRNSIPREPERVIFLVSRSLLNLSSSRSRSRRSPVRSASKSGDDGGGEDSDGSDPEPPRLKHRPLAALFSLEGRRAA